MIAQHPWLGVAYLYVTRDCSVTLLQGGQRQKWASVQQFSLGVQHEFPGNNVLSMSYVGSLGRHLARSREANQVPIGVTTMQAPELAGIPGCDAAGSCDVQTLLMNGVPNIFFVPYRGYTNITMKENTAVSSYNSLQANFSRSYEM